MRLHWTLPLGALVFGRGRFDPGFWVGFILVVLIHEIGHAAMVRRFRCRVLAIDVHALGGVCRWQGEPTAIERALIAWGGVTAQAALYVVTLAAIGVLGDPPTAFAFQLATAYTSTNLYLIAINLLPVPPLDGAEAWKLVPLLARRLRFRAPRRRGRADVPPPAFDVEPSAETKAAVNELLEKLRRDPGSKLH